MAKGAIKNIIADKGFGFITPEGAQQGDKDIFFHFTALSNGLRIESLNKGDVVEFETEQGQRGINAVNVRLAGSEADSAETEEVTETEEVAE